MDLKEHSYSILLVSSEKNFPSVFAGLLPSARYAPVFSAKNIAAAKRAFAKRSFDFVIINTPLTDEMGTRFAIDIGTSKQTVVLLLVNADIHDSIHDKVVDYGILTLPKPTSKPILIRALSWMESMRERLCQFEKKSSTIEEKMAEIRLVNKAKWILITELKMSEPDAHRYIEKQAMDRCIAKKKIAEDIIKTYT